MLRGLGLFVHRRRLSCLLTCLLMFGLFGLWGTSVFSRLSTGGFADPNAPSTIVDNLQNLYFGNTSPDILVVYRSPTMTVDDAAFRSAVVGTLNALPKAGVAQVASYWSTKYSSFVSFDKHATFVGIDLDGTNAQKSALFDRLAPRLRAPGLDTRIAGGVPVINEFNTQVQADLTRAESISLPILLVLLFLIFGSLASAVLPLVVGVFSILGALTILRLLTAVTTISSFSVEVVSMLGLGLAIDYSLLIVNRFREEMARGNDRPTALANTLATAGRAVAFSGITITTALGSLLLFPEMFLRSVGIGAMAVVLVAIFGALVLLPALLALMGKRVDFLRLPWRRPLGTSRARTDQGVWYRLARSVMRRPVLYFLGVLVVLAILVEPFGHVRFGAVDVRVLPASNSLRQTYQEVQDDFPDGQLEPIDVVISGSLIPRGWTPAQGIPPYLVSYKNRIAHLPGVTAAEFSGYAGSYAAVQISVTYPYQAISASAYRLVRAIRAVPLDAPANGAYVDVGGPSAAQLDLMTSLGRVLPEAAAFIVIATFALLFAAFGSVLLPVKAVAMNLLSLGASFGVVVWGFQYGHLAGLLGFTPTGSVEVTSMILILVGVYGLSMDYEVFLLSRVREEWDRTGDNTAAVAVGLQRTGGIITSAAGLFMVVVAAFSMAQISIVKMIGVGFFVALVVDATLVRMLLVPATMRMLGRANWWLPRPLRRIHQALRPVPAMVPAVAAPVPAAPRPVPWPPDPRPRPKPAGQREIVPNPTGPGWRWKISEDDHVHR